MESINQIIRFVGERSFLSNFYASTFYVRGKSYRSVEHAYQAHKATSDSEHETIRCVATPMEAKRLGRTLVLRDGWDSERVGLMTTFVRAKFENPILRELLIATGSSNLVHDNKFNDRFWGVCRGVGENHLGIILMMVREEIMNLRDSGDE